VFPVSMRTTGHGIAAGIGKLGAFIGVFLVPVLQRSIGLRGMLLVAAGSAVLGYLVTLILPETAGRTLESISSEDPPCGEVPRPPEPTPIGMSDVPTPLTIDRQVAAMDGVAN
jgi:PHS family inorganic phosphate transporter-like MFS transporter